MKAIKILQMSFLLAAALTLGLTSCKKDKNSDTGSNTTSIQNLTNDENRANAAADEALNDINTVLAGNNGLKSAENVPCNATVDSTAVLNDTITYYVTYNGLNCAGNLNRTGKIEISKHVGTQWWQMGAAITYHYIDFHVLHINSNKQLILNGRKTVVNVTGGLIFMIPQYITSVTHKDSGYMNITFDNGDTKFWQVARQITYTRVNNKFVTTIDGFGTADGYNNLIHWGINRNGEQFYIQILQPVVHRQACQWDPCAGQKKMTIPGDNKGATITFGYDNNNQPVTGPECPTKYKVDWYKNGNSGTLYLFL